jgi:hypothetical protein
MKRKGKTYIIMTDDGMTKDVFLTWTTDMGGYYTTVDWVEDINEFDLHDTVESARMRATDANSGTLFGWQAPMKIMELLNFEDAYNGDEEPELKLVDTITFNN